MCKAVREKGRWYRYLCLREYRIDHLIIACSSVPRLNAKTCECPHSQVSQVWTLET